MEEFITETLKELGILHTIQHKIYTGIVSLYYAEFKTKDNKYIRVKIPFTSSTILYINKETNYLGVLDNKNKILLSVEEFDTMRELNSTIDSTENLNNLRKNLEDYFLYRTRNLCESLTEIEGVIKIKLLKGTSITLVLLIKDEYLDIPLKIEIGEINYIKKSLYKNERVINEIYDMLGGAIEWV